MHVTAELTNVYDKNKQFYILADSFLEGMCWQERAETNSETERSPESTQEKN